MPKPSLITITKSEMIHPRVAEIKGVGPGRRIREYVVYFTCKGVVDGAYEFKPDEQYLRPEEIPSVVNNAAKAVYRSDQT